MTRLAACKLGYVYQARQAMRLVFGKLLDGHERTHVVLCALDAVPHGVEAHAIYMPPFAAADCYNAAYAACLDVQEDRKAKVKQ